MSASILKKRSLLTVKILFLYSPEIVFSQQSWDSFCYTHIKT